MEFKDFVKDKLFITDVGASERLDIDGQEATVGRFAVWSPMTVGNHHAVIEVAEDLAFLQNKYGIPDEMVCRIKRGGESRGA